MEQHTKTTRSKRGGKDEKSETLPSRHNLDERQIKPTANSGNQTDPGTTKTSPVIAAVAPKLSVSAAKLARQKYYFKPTTHQDFPKARPPSLVVDGRSTERSRALNNMMYKKIYNQHFEEK